MVTCYMNAGERETGESYLLRALEIAEQMGDTEAVLRTRFQTYVSKFLKADYEPLYRELLGYKKDPRAWEPQNTNYLLGTCAMIMGQPDKAIKYLDSFLETTGKTPLRFGSLEMKALSLRIIGKLPEAMKTLIESAEGYMSYASAYSAFPLAKALEISRLAGVEPPPKKLIKKALILARKGGRGEQAAAEEIEALLREDDADAADRLLGAVRNYLRAHQNIEAVLSGFTAAYLAWKTDSPAFTKAIKLIAPFVPLHPGFKLDPLLGDFISKTEPFLREVLWPSQDKKGIRAYLIGKLKVMVDGKEIKMKAWRNNKAIKGLVYLLLSSEHKMPADHLFYLLWPRRAYNKKISGGYIQR